MRPARSVFLAALLSSAGAACDKPAFQEPDQQAPSTSSPLPPAKGLVDVTAPLLLDAIRKSPYQAVLVNAWASWCGPCKRELPMFEKLSRELGPKGIGVWFVSVDDLEDKPEALKVLAASGVRGPTLYAAGSLDAFKRGLNPRWPGMIPATFLFDASGKLRYFWGGPVYETELMPVVQGLLAGRDIDGEADFTLAPGKTTE